MLANKIQDMKEKILMNLYKPENWQNTVKLNSLIFEK